MLGRMVIGTIGIGGGDRQLHLQQGRQGGNGLWTVIKAKSSLQEITFQVMCLSPSLSHAASRLHVAQRLHTKPSSQIHFLHRITEWRGLGGTPGDHLVQPPCLSRGTQSRGTGPRPGGG